jgi:WD40 repeat protein
VEAGKTQSRYHYWAFISYSHADEAWAGWLHRALEKYRVPAHLPMPATKAGKTPRRLIPIFRDTDELPVSADLGAKLRESLRASRFLIVICSPRSAKSKWVNQEILEFKAAGGEDRILAVIVDGEPHAADPARECFPPALRQGDAEPLGCDMRQQHDGRSNCKLRLIAGMLGVSFDRLKQREKQRRRRRILLATAATLLFLVILAAFATYSLRQSDIAESRRLALESQEIVSIDPASALQLAIEAAASAETVEAVRALSSSLSFQLTRAILDHPSEVSSAVFSPDARRVLSCLLDGSAHVWDSTHGNVLFSLGRENSSEGNGPVSCLFSADGSLILTVAPGSGARLWDGESGKLRVMLSGHEGDVVSAGFSPDGSMVVTAGRDKTARVWDSRTGRQLTLFEGHESPVQKVFFFPDNSRVVSIGRQGKAVVWKVSSGEEIRRFGDSLPFVQDALLSPDGSRLLISNYQYDARLWDPSSGELIGQLGTRFLGAAFSGDSQRLVTGSGDGEVRVWEAEDAMLVKTLPHQEMVSSVLVSPDGSLVLTADTKPHVWQMPELGGGAEAEIFSLRSPDQEPMLADISEDGKQLLTFASGGRAVRVWSITDGPHVRSFGELDHRIGNVLFSPDGSKIMTSGSRIQIWNASATRRMATTQVPPQLSSGGVFSHDGSRLVGHCRKGQACVFDTSNGDLVLALERGDGLALAISPDGSSVALTGPAAPVLVYDVSTAEVTGSFGEGEGRPYNILFSPDGRQLFANLGGVVRYWDLDSGRMIERLEGVGPRFSPDGVLVATRRDDLLYLNRREDGRLLQELSIGGGIIQELAFSPDSSLLAAGSTDGVITLWDLVSAEKRVFPGSRNGRVRLLRFSGDGRTLVTVTDNAIHAYSTADGTELQMFHNNFGLVNAAIAPDGASVVGVDTLGRALFYSFRLQPLLEIARKRLPAIGTVRQAGTEQGGL